MQISLPTGTKSGHSWRQRHTLHMSALTQLVICRSINRRRTPQVCIYMVHVISQTNCTPADHEKCCRYSKHLQFLWASHHVDPLFRFPADSIGWTQNDSSRTWSQLWHMLGHAPGMQPGVKLKVRAYGGSKYGCSTVTCLSKSMCFYSYPSASFIHPASNKSVNIQHLTQRTPWYPTSDYCHSTPHFCLVNSKPPKIRPQ
jgi:hypothetical protein